MMRRMISVGIALLVVAPLVACAPTDQTVTAPTSSSSSVQLHPSPTTVPKATETAVTLSPIRPPSCAARARYDAYKVEGGEWEWSITGVRVDTGSTNRSSGTANAELPAYVVASGDTFTGIGDRFCIDSVHLAMINHRQSGELVAGETILLYPEGPAVDYVPDPDA